MRRTDYEVHHESPMEQRGRVVRMAVLFGALFGGATALVLLALFKIVSGDGGFAFMLILFGLLDLLFLYFVRMYVRDLTAAPVPIEGEVMKKWHKGNLLFFFMTSYYIVVEGKIISIPRQDYALLLETDLVRVTCYPHSLTVERVERYDETEKRFVPATHGALG